MKLKYVKGKQVTIHERRRMGGVSSPYPFSPYGIVPDYVGARILKNPRYEGWFIEVQPFPCEVCGEDVNDAKTLAFHRVNVHKIKKGKKNEKVIVDDIIPNGTVSAEPPMDDRPSENTGVHNENGVHEVELYERNSRYDNMDRH